MIRFGDIICLLYGSDPEEFEQLMDDLEVPDRRKYQCIRRYKEREESWERLMAPYLSESGATGDRSRNHPRGPVRHAEV